MDFDTATIVPFVTATAPSSRMFSSLISRPVAGRSVNPLAVTSCFALWTIKSAGVRVKGDAVTGDAAFASIVCVPVENN